MIGVAIFAESFADIFFFVRDIIFKFGLLALRQETFNFVEDSHIQSSFRVD